MSLSDIVILLALCAVVSEGAILVYIGRFYFQGKRHLLMRKGFMELLQSSLENPDALPFDMMWIVQLTRDETSHLEIRELLRKQFVRVNDRIQSLSNLGPAVGLIFTFIGMLVAVLALSRGNIQDAETIQESVKGLYPVFVGGACGILVYAIGVYLLDKLEVRQEIAERELFAGVMKYLKAAVALSPKTPQEALDRLLKRVAKLSTQFEGISNTFEQICQKTDELTQSFSARTDSFVIALDERSQSLSVSFGKNVQAVDSLNSNLRQFSDSVAVGAQGWKDSSAIILRLSDSLTNMEKELGTLRSVAQASVQLTSRLDINTTSIGELVTEVKKESTEIANVVTNVGKLAEAIHGYADEVKFGATAVEDMKISTSKNISEVARRVGEVTQALTDQTALKEGTQYKGSNGEHGGEETIPSPQAIQVSVDLPASLGTQLENQNSQLSRVIRALDHLTQILQPISASVSHPQRGFLRLWRR